MSSLRIAVWVGITFVAIVAGTCKARTSSSKVPVQIEDTEQRDSFVLTMTDTPTKPWGTVLSGLYQGDPAHDFRWSGPDVKMVFHVPPSPDDLYMDAEFYVSDVVLRSIGPQTVTFVMNARPIATTSTKDAKIYSVSVPVAHGIREASTIPLEMLVSPTYRGQDGSPLGVLLHRCGFRFQAAQR